MRYDVAEAGEIDLVGLDRTAHGAFDSMHDIEQMVTLVSRQVGHLRDMRLPDDATEAGKRGAFATAHADDAANRILPEGFAAGLIAKFACAHAKKIAQSHGSQLEAPYNGRP